jgi:hypothetical protein
MVKVFLLTQINKYMYLLVGSNNWYAQFLSLDSDFYQHGAGNDRSSIMPKCEFTQTKISALLRLLWWSTGSNQHESWGRQASHTVK